MKTPPPPSQSKRLRLLAGLAPLAIGAPWHGQAEAQVIWEPVTEEQADQLQILVPAVDGGATNVQTSPSESNASPQSAAPQPIVWEVVPDPEASDLSTTKPSSPTEVVWEPLSNSPSIAADGSDNGASNAIVWEVLPETIAPLAPEGTDTIAGVENYAPTGDSTANASEEPPAEVVAQEEAMPPRVIPGPPPPPPLQALNRSIAFGDGLVGPDIGWRVPNGFRWSQRWFADASIRGFSRRKEGEDFLAWNNGDGNAVIHANVLQTKNWSLALNTSFRSVYQGENAAGGSTAAGEGVSSGFRIARQIGNTGGIAFGGEQVIQWDDKTDTGRNLYLMASKGWWLGNNGQEHPLLIANGGFGTGRFASQDIDSSGSLFRFACIENIDNRTGTFRVDNDLCWGPIGTISLVMNEWWGMFLEYRGGTAQAAASVNLTGGLPLRLTWGVNFAKSNEIQDAEDFTWVFRASFGF